MGSKVTKPNHDVPHYKFLTRNIDFQKDHNLIFQKICLKRLYLKKFIDRRKPLSLKETCYRPFKKNSKLFKTLREVQVPSFSQSYTYEALKNCKTISRINLNLMTEDAKTEKVARFVKRLPPTIKQLSLSALESGQEAKEDFCRIAKSIRYLSKLESFQRSCFFFHEKKANNVPKELRIYSQTASRLKKIKDVSYCVHKTDQIGFQRAVRKGKTFPGITGLDMYLSIEHSIEHEFDSTKICNLPAFNKMTEDQQKIYLLVQEEIKNRGGDEEKAGDFDFGDDQRFSTVDMDFLANCLMHEEMKPFFRFDLFPNLKCLGISQEFDLYPFGSFVVDGFAALKNLQRLHIDISDRPQGTGYLFKGFLKLPLLKEFSLSIDFIKKADWVLLQEFLKNQNDLTSLTLRVEERASSKSQYERQNIHLQNIIQDLENKRSLKMLSLRVKSCSLEAISQGFAHLSMINQIQSLIFEAIDDTVFSQEKPLRRVEGLCSFIKNQKDSLKTLAVYLPFVLEESIVVHIAETTTKMTQIREMVWFINPNLLGGIKHFQKYFEQILQSEIPPDCRIIPKGSKQFNPNLVKYVRRLENLENFVFVFDMVDVNITTWVLDVIRVLPNLKKLQKICISSYSIDKIRSIEADFMKIIPELDHVREIKYPVFITEEISNFVCFILSPDPKLEKMINETNKRKSLKCDLMF